MHDQPPDEARGRHNALPATIHQAVDMERTVGQAGGQTTPESASNNALKNTEHILAGSFFLVISLLKKKEVPYIKRM